jgi:2-succinyl-5-enolpyruvyl-6-hydroxy-3-cyclohexene-1-carboxylate synthase
VVHTGPVHLNVGFRLPLVPDPAPDPGADPSAVPNPNPNPGPDPTPSPDPDPDPTGGRSAPRGGASPPRHRIPPFSGCDYREAGEVLGQLPTRGVVLVGDLPCTSLRGHHQWILELATTCGWPVIGEPSANVQGAANTLAHGVLVLGAPHFLEQHAPELVLTLGGFGLSRPSMQLLRAAGRHVAIELPTSGREVCDPLRTADTVLTGIPLPPRDFDPDPEWLTAWRQADEVAGQVVAQQLSAGPLSGAALGAQVFQDAPADALLLVAASWPVRHVEAFGGPRTGCRVIGNRGANGIDGLVATTWGATLAHQSAGGGPGLALLGDLAFLHDHNGLLAGAGEPRPDLVLVVSDNNGGGIFHQLEQGRPEYTDSFERIFGTPQTRDLVAVAEAAGIPAVRVAERAAVRSAVAEAIALGGVRVVVVDVADRAVEAQLLVDVRAEVARRLATGP